MKKLLPFVLVALLTGCGQESVRDRELRAPLVVGTAERNRVCGAAFGSVVACHIGGTVYIRESIKLPAGKYTLVIPPNSWIPHPHDTDFGRLSACGYELAAASSFDVEPNQAVSLCHEASHVIGYTH